MDKTEKENKLKEFVSNHKLAFTIAGGVLCTAVGAGIGYLVGRPSEKIRSWTSIIPKDADYLGWSKAFDGTKVKDLDDCDMLLNTIACNPNDDYLGMFMFFKNNET